MRPAYQRETQFVIESQRLESSRVAAGFAIENASLVVKRVGCVDAPHALSPSPQLFPNLDECLYFSRAGQSVVNQSAIFERAFVELANTIGTQVCEVLTKLLKLLFVQYIRFFATWSPGHSERS
jgi:hypothetical protein